MSPSRGTTTTTTTTTTTSPTTAETPTEAKADLRSASALTSLQKNLSYLLHPSSSSSSASAPTRLRTRALLRSLHYLSIFIFWRIVRYAKYAIVGSVVAAVGSTAVGSGVAFFVAPPTLLASVGVGLVWAVGRWGFRRMGRGGGGGGPERRGVDGVGGGRQGVRADGGWRGEQGPEAVPW